MLSFESYCRSSYYYRSKAVASSIHYHVSCTYVRIVCSMADSTICSVLVVVVGSSSSSSSSTAVNSKFSHWKGLNDLSLWV